MNDMVSAVSRRFKKQLWSGSEKTRRVEKNFRTGNTWRWQIFATALLICTFTSNDIILTHRCSSQAGWTNVGGNWGRITTRSRPLRHENIKRRRRGSQDGLGWRMRRSDRRDGNTRKVRNFHFRSVLVSTRDGSTRCNIRIVLHCECTATMYIQFYTMYTIEHAKIYTQVCLMERGEAW